MTKLIVALQNFANEPKKNKFVRTEHVRLYDTMRVIQCQRINLCQISMKYGIGVLCRKLSRKREFHENGLGDVILYLGN
jgi:hypothetical protein